ncbi:hypothetical protein K438DRAFT_1964886 [Mycena galopus ATCC 62051]|nr:hypothetical protein K438DRAFT_1964886 [Mycena galopus ATCC 62051]
MPRLEDGDKFNRSLDFAGDSDKVNVPLESPARILIVVTSDAPLPNHRPPCPPVSPADSAAARKLGVAWKPSPAPKCKIKRQAADSMDHGTLWVKLEDSLGTIQVSRPRTQTPQTERPLPLPVCSLRFSLGRWNSPPFLVHGVPALRGSAVFGAGMPSTRPLFTAGVPSSSHDGMARSPPKASRSRRVPSVHSDTSSVEFISRVLMDDEGADADAMPGVEPPPLSPTITSASSLSSSTAFSISTASTTAASTPAQGSATPAQGSATSAQRSAAPTVRGDLDLMMVDEDDDQQGPFFLNVLL